MSTKVSEHKYRNEKNSKLDCEAEPRGGRGVGQRSCHISEAVLRPNCIVQREQTAQLRLVFGGNAIQQRGRVLEKVDVLQRQVLDATVAKGAAQLGAQSAVILQMPLRPVVAEVDALQLGVFVHWENL